MAKSVIMVATLLVSAVCLSSVSCQHNTILHHQAQKLKNLLCEPKAVVVNIKDHLSLHDPLTDHEFFPREVAVNRCLPNQSFCGNYHLGVPIGECQPDPQGVAERGFVVYYFKGGEQKFQEVEVTEHRACVCSANKETSLFGSE